VPLFPGTDFMGALLVRRAALALAALISLSLADGGMVCGQEPRAVRRYLYVLTPGIRNYLEFGGAGILVFDIDQGHKFVKRIETPASMVERPDNIKGVCAHAGTGRLYFTTRSTLYQPVEQIRVLCNGRQFGFEGRASVEVVGREW
jgi:hypothetical protein